MSKNLHASSLHDFWIGCVSGRFSKLNLNGEHPLNRQFEDRNQILVSPHHPLRQNT